MPMSDNRLTERVHAAVRTAVREAGITRLLVACSGGGDSVCLAHAVATVARREGWQAALGHVRHGVRDNDADDARLVETLAQTLGMPVVQHVYDAASLSPNEAALRAARYAALAVMAVRCEAEAVLTGHTQDDQAETVLLRLLRGTGIDGLAGMVVDGALPVAGSTATRLLRPLLDIWRSETHAYCIAHALPYHDDPSNTDTRYARNWVRHIVFPTLTTRFPAVAPTLTRTAALAAEDAAFLRELTDAALGRCTAPSPYPLVTTLDRRAFAAEPVALQRRVLRLLTALYTGTAPRFDRLEIARRALSEAMGTSPVAINGTMFWPAYGHVTVGKEADVVATVRHRLLQTMPLQRFAVPLPLTGEYLFENTDSLAVGNAVRFRLALALVSGETAAPGAKLLCLPAGATVMLRNRLPGDRFHPAGAPGLRTLQDHLRERGIPAPLRDEVPLLVMNNEIVAVPGWEMSQQFLASPTTATHSLAFHRVSVHP